MSVDRPGTPPERQRQAAAGREGLRSHRDSLRAIHAQARQWADVLRLPFRQHRWRGHAGEFSGTGVGSSLDFQDHRAYMPGDDPRQINWQAFARTGHYTMKLYREEVRPLVDVIFDVSASMFAFPAKERRALDLFYYAFESAFRTGSSVRIHAVDGNAHRLLPEDAILSHGWPDELGALASSGGVEPPSLGRLPLRAGSLRLLLSDLLFPGAPESVLTALTTRNGRGLVFAPFGREEADPGWDGNFEFVDAESGGHRLHRVEPALLRRYEQAYRRHFDFWKVSARKHGVALARVSAEVPFETALRAEAVAVGAIEV